MHSKLIYYLTAIPAFLSVEALNDLEERSPSKATAQEKLSSTKTVVTTKHHGHTKILPRHEDYESTVYTTVTPASCFTHPLPPPCTSVAKPPSPPDVPHVIPPPIISSHTKAPVPPMHPHEPTHPQSYPKPPVIKPTPPPVKPPKPESTPCITAVTTITSPVKPPAGCSTCETAKIWVSSEIIPIDQYLTPSPKFVHSVDTLEHVVNQPPATEQHGPSVSSSAPQPSSTEQHIPSVSTPSKSATQPSNMEHHTHPVSSLVKSATPSSSKVSSSSSYSFYSHSGSYSGMPSSTGHMEMPTNPPHHLKLETAGAGRIDGGFMALVTAAVAVMVVIPAF